MNAISLPNGVAAQSSADKGEARVFLVDDHALIRKGLRAVVDRSPGLTVCGEAGTAAETLAGVAKTQPDAVVVDISLPGSSGVDLVRDLRLRFPGLAVMVLSMHDEKIYAERVLRVGAQGYVMKQDPPERVIDGIRAVLRGELFVSSEIANTLLHTFVSASPRQARKVGVDRLSNREIEVFQAIGRGQATREIAEQLSLSVKTVETYRANIKRKLGLPSSNGLVYAAIQWNEADANGAQPERL